MKHIGIIGSGWLAQALANAWQSQYRITLTTRSPDKQKQLKAVGFHAVLYSLGHDLSLLTDIDCLIIATTSKDLSAHRQLVNQLKNHPDLPVLFTSSSSVYPNNGQSHAEDSPDIKTDHPLYQIEQCLQQHPKTTIIRCGGLIGPGRHPGRFFRNKAIPSPKAPVNLLPLTDAIGIFSHIIEQQITGTTVNACHNEHPLKGDYYPIMARSIDLPAPDIRHDIEGQGKIVDTRRLTNELNYSLKSDIWQIAE